MVLSMRIREIYLNEGFIILPYYFMWFLSGETYMTHYQVVMLEL